MNKDRKINSLQQERLKKHPFEVPEGYFASFSDRLQERIREEESAVVPVRRLGSSTRFRVALAAAVLGVALISYSVYRFTNTSSMANGSYLDMALLEQMQVFDDTDYLYELIESEANEMDEEEAFAAQAIDYLAINDADMVLLFE